MRNGVIAITREGYVAVLNGVACQVLNVPVRASNLGCHYSEILGSTPEIMRILGTAFESEYLPNRAEMRLASGPVIGYTLSLIRDDEGRATGAAHPPSLKLRRTGRSGATCYNKRLPAVALAEAGATV